MTYSGLSEFERQVEEARQNNLAVQEEQQIIEAERKIQNEADYVAQVEEGQKSGPTLTPGSAEQQAVADSLGHLFHPLMKTATPALSLRRDPPRHGETRRICGDSSNQGRHRSDTQ